MEARKLFYTLLALLAFGLIAWAVEVAVDRYRSRIVNPQTRAQWEANHRWNEPFPPWQLATWRERGEMVSVAIVIGVLTAVAVAGFLYVVSWITGA